MSAQYLTPQPVATPRKPRLAAPPGATDCHLHLFGPAARYPFDPASPYRSADALPETYLRVQEILGLGRAVVVSGAGYGRDMTHLLDTLARFPDRFRGVALPPDDVGDAQLERMRSLGVRGVRCFSAARWKHLPMLSAKLAHRAAAFGMHVQFYAHAGDLPDYEARLRDLHVAVVLDHFGAVDAPRGVDQPAMASLLRLLDTGRVWVKLSGPMRCTPGDFPYAEVTPIARALVRHAPQRLLWGSDWPHTNMVGRSMPDDGDLLDLLGAWVDDDAARRLILVDNPMTLYGFPAP